jgi:hypothetical protein
MSDTDALLLLQKAIVDRLKSSPAIVELVGDRVFDDVPPAALKPYISLGPRRVLVEAAAEYEGSDSRLQIDGWSEAVGMVEAQKIGCAVRDALHNAPLDLGDGQRLISIDFQRANYLRTQDGQTKHAVLLFRARTEPSN